MRTYEGTCGRVVVHFLQVLRVLKIKLVRLFKIDIKNTERNHRTRVSR